MERPVVSGLERFVEVWKDYCLAPCLQPFRPEEDYKELLRWLHRGCWYENEATPGCECEVPKEDAAFKEVCKQFFIDLSGGRWNKP